MGYFLRKFILLTVFIIISLVCINIIVWGYSSYEENFDRFEDEYLVKKHHQVIEKFEIEFNDRLFFGTSKIFRQFNPIQFDSLVADSIKSYNFGHAALFPFRLFDYTELILSNLKSKFEGEIFIELTVPQSITEKNYRTTEIQNAINLKRVISLISDEHYFGTSHILTSIYVNRYALFSLFKKFTLSGALSQGIDDSESTLKKGYIFNHRGFYPLEYDKRPGVLQQRKGYFMGDSIISVDQEIDPFYNFNSTYANEIINWVNDFADKPKRVFFIITPRHSKKNLKYIFSLAEKLEKQGFSILNLANSNRYPELYQRKYSFDKGHLNLLGTEYFNQYLFKLYINNKSYNDLP